MNIPAAQAFVESIIGFIITIMFVVVPLFIFGLAMVVESYEYIVKVVKDIRRK